MPATDALAKPHKRAKRRARAAAVERAVPVYHRDGSPNVQAHAAMVVDLTSGEELLARNADEERPIASISKLMAALVVLENAPPEHPFNPEGTTTITEEDRRIASGGARSRLPVGMAFSNRDLMHAALMASDNRSVPALGRSVGWTPGQLVAAMNRRAKELELRHTHFEDPVGLNSQNRSTARDLIKLLRAAMKNHTITEVTQKKTYVAHPAGRPSWKIDYTNTDVITRAGKYEVLTGKTGYTDLAQYCLAIAVNVVADRPVAMVFLGAQGKMTRFGDVNRVAQWLVERRWARRADL
jgi:D-alanyl-D-alanine endopeptidase (penicillin-binding protein 7)